MARSKLTPARQKKIVRHIRDMNFACVAAELSGITDRCFWKWMRRGEEELERREQGKKARAPESMYVRFVLAVTHARAHAESRAVKAIAKASEDRIIKDKNGKVVQVIPADWRAAIEYLKRTSGDRWNVAQRVVHSGDPEGEPVQHDHVHVIEGARERLARELDRIADRQRQRQAPSTNSGNGRRRKRTAV